jgi:predicted GNAT family acetyltransferase
VQRSDVVVTDNRREGRYEGRIDGELVGFCDYRRDSEHLVLPHTETLPAFRGRGIADVIVDFVLKDPANEDLTVVPQCWFVEEFMARRGARAAGS